MKMTEKERKAVRFLAARHRAGEKPLTINETAKVVGQEIGDSSHNAAVILRGLIEAGHLKVEATLSGEFFLVPLPSILTAEEEPKSGLVSRLKGLFGGK